MLRLYQIGFCNELMAERPGPPARSSEGPSSADGLTAEEVELSAKAAKNVVMWRRNLMLMAFFFSVGESCVSTPLGYATALLGPALGAICGGLGMLWVVVSCLLVGPFAVKGLGAKWTMLIGMALNSVFAVAFAFATTCPQGSLEQWAIMLVSPLCSGLGVGLIWTAQGTFFTSTVALVVTWSRKPKPMRRNSVTRRSTLTESGEGVIDEVAPVPRRISLPTPAEDETDAIDAGRPIVRVRSFSEPVEELAPVVRVRSRRRSMTEGDALALENIQKREWWLQRTQAMSSAGWAGSRMVFVDPADLEPFPEHEVEEHDEDASALLDKATATAMLGSTFAAIFLATDVLMKISVSLLQGSFIVDFHEPFVDVSPMFIGEAVISVLMIFGIAILKNPEQGEYPPSRPRLDSEITRSGFCARISGAVRLWRLPELWLFGLTAFTFGLAAGYLNAYVNGTLTASNSALGAESIGALMAISSVVAASLSLLFGPLAARVGKGPIVAFGAIAFAAVPSAVFAGQPCAENDYWGTGLILLYVLQGIGRAVYESTNKAVFADNFSASQSAGVFANVMMMNGISFFIASVLQSVLDSIEVLESVIVVSAALTPVGYLLATWLRARRAARGPLMGASLQPLQKGS